MLSLSARNVSTVRFVAYRVYPEEVYGRAQYTHENEHWRGRPQFTDFGRQWSDNNGAGGFRKEKVAEWTATTGDDGKHGYVSVSVKTPLDSLGAYLIEARAGERDGIRSRTLLLVSDLTIVQKVDKSGVLVYAANAITGKPVPNVKLTLWEPTRAQYSYDRDARYASGQTDESGTFRASLPTPTDSMEANYIRQRRCATFASAGGERYAVTSQADFNNGDVPVGESAFRAYVMTDRSLYRPNQAINLRVVMVSGTPGAYLPAVGKAASLVITGPHGELLRKDIKTGEFGSVNDTFALPTGADLGDYAVHVQTPTEPRAEYGNVSFRVEEYKKPEFAVSVTPEASQVRIGETMKVAIGAQFFFGAPVVNAKVHYRVVRAPYAYPTPVRPRLDWYDETPASGFSLAGNYNASLSLAGYRGRGGYGDSIRNWQQAPDTSWANQGAAYREGDLTTDAKGEAFLTFPTELPKPPRGVKASAYNPGDQNYIITADVVDDSRRQVSGAGSARATVAQFHPFLTLDRQFVLPGESLTIDARTRDGNDKPFAAGGYVHFTRLIPPVLEIKRIDPNTGKYVIVQKAVPAKEEDQGKLFVQTDAANDGLGKAVWHPDTPGDYRLDYEAKDAWGNVVQAVTNVLVYGSAWDAQIPEADKRFQMVAEHTMYKPGDTARVLLIAPAPDSYVLFTEQAIGGIVRYRTIFVPGRSTLIDVPINATHVPNAAFTAMLIRDGQAQEAGCEVGVPAEDHILALQIKPDKSQYKPGEHAIFAVHAIDAQGHPAQGEVSLGVVDQSLRAMQADLVPDIRRAFYGYRLETQVAGVNSVNLWLGGDAQAPPVPGFESHELVYPEGMGWLVDHLDAGRKFAIPAYTPYSRYSLQTRNSRGRGGRAMFYDYSGARSAGEQPELAYDAALGDSINGVTRLSAGRTSNMPLGSATLAKRKDSAQGFLQGISPQDIFALDADNSLVLRYDDPKQILERQAILRSGDAGALAAATVRRLFADTAVWMPAIVTDKQGNATVAFDFPDNITQWHVTARGVTRDIQVGMEEAETRTKKNLLVRLQAPRFFVDRDQVTISANVHNYLDADKNARVELVTEGGSLEIAQSAGKAAVTAVTARPVGKNGEIRVDWTVDVKKAGLTKIKVIVQTDAESDAAEMAFPVLVHGVEKFIAHTGVLKDGGNATETFDLPSLRRQGASLLDVQLSPSLASVMLDALPYLEDYPYGCVEQTTSRFVPTVLVAKTLRDAGIDLETLGKRAAALAEQRRAIPPQQIFADSGYTYPKGAPGVLDAKELSSRLAYGYHGRTNAPVFSSATLKDMTETGLQKLYQMQRADGSWGWWTGSAVGDPYLTAYVVESLVRARQADIAVKPDVLERAFNYLEAHFDSTEDLHLMAYYDYVLCFRATIAKVERTERWRKTHLFLYERRDRLNAYGHALLALAFHFVGDEEKARVLVRNLTTTVKRDADGHAAHWEADDRAYWRWYNDKQETTATVLRALVAVGGEENTSLAGLAVRWLVDNRRGGYWTSTKQTALVVESLMEYARAQKELTPDYTVTLDVDGKVQKSYHLTKENALLFDNRFLVGDEILTSGGQQLHITMQGTGTLYYSAYMKYFDMSEPITAQSNAIAVERKYFKVVPEAGKTGKAAKTGGKSSKSETVNNRLPLADGATIASGDILEVELFLKSDNDYDHLVFEDMKPAGCEAVETRSGQAYGDGLCSNMELRDEKVAFFIDTLPQGTRRLTYRLRAEIPGMFHALPTNAYAMYAPDIRALSDEWRATITDALPGKAK